MNNRLYLFVGKSASGKTTIADALSEQYGLNQIQSYTTRLPRYEGEPGHIFITKEEFNQLQNIVAYTQYDTNEYCATEAQVDDASIYVVDIPGVKSLLERYSNTSRSICIIYFDATVHTRIHRMLDRGDHDNKIISRLLEDEKEDWWRQIEQLVWHHCNNLHRDVEAYQVNANYALDKVIEQVWYYMNEHKEYME